MSSRMLIDAALVVLLVACGCSEPASPTPAPVEEHPSASDGKIIGPVHVEIHWNGEPESDRLTRLPARQFGPDPYRDMDQGIHVPDDSK